MAKSRNNVSRRKNRKSLKKRSGRKNFRKMSGGYANLLEYLTGVRCFHNKDNCVQRIRSFVLSTIQANNDKPFNYPEESADNITNYLLKKLSITSNSSDYDKAISEEGHNFISMFNYEKLYTYLTGYAWRTGEVDEMFAKQ